MTHFTRYSLVITLHFLAGRAAPAQGPMVTPLNPPSLAIGIQDGAGGFVYTAPTAPVNSTHLGKLRVSAAPGTWTAILVQSYIKDLTQPGSPAETGLLAAFPWLAPMTPQDPSSWLPLWSAVPAVSVAQWQAMFYALNSVLMPDGSPSENIVRAWFQPCVDTAGAQPGSARRVWNANAPVWTSDASGTGIGPIMAELWKPYTTEIGTDPELLSLEGLARLGVFLQAPSLAAAQNFLTQATYYDAATVGLYVSVQALTVISGDPGFQPTTNESTTPGLTGLLTGHLPTTAFTNPITIRVALGAPATCSCGGSTGIGGGTIALATGGLHRLPLLRAFPAMTAVFAGPGGLPVNGVVLLQPDILRPFRAGIIVPMNAETGPVRVINGLGTASAEPIFNLHLVPTPGGGG